jgi:RNA-directed DNA polymerase
VGHFNRALLGHFSVAAKLNVGPSTKALKKEREMLHEMTDHRQCYKPIPQLIEEINRHLKGWKN